jgi:enoyl-CoA hydratase/carnithine racemase
MSEHGDDKHLVLLEISSSGIATVTLNDPARRNAMDNAMASAFAARIDELRNVGALRAVILTGAGVAFAAGGDLGMLQKKAELDAESNRREMLDFYHAFLCILDLPVPLIAAVNGHAIGAGFCLALACEARVVSSAARLGLTFTRLGLHPGMGATCFLPRIGGLSVANDLLISGRVINAEEADEMGLTNQVVPPQEVLATAIEMAESFLTSGPNAVAGLLQTLRPSAAQLEAALEREASEQSMNYGSEEFQGGVAAALQRRPPSY